MPGRMHYLLFVRKASRGSCAASRNAHFALTWHTMLPWVPQQVPSTLDDTLMHGASVNFTGMHCLTWIMPTLDVAKPVGASLWHLGMHRVSWNPLWCTGIHQYALNFTLTHGVSLQYLGIHVCQRDAPSVRAASVNALSARTAFRMQRCIWMPSE